MKFISSKTGLLLVAMLIFLVTLVLTQRMVVANAERVMPIPQTASTDPEVSIIWRQAGRFAGSISAYGATHSHYEVTLTAQVDGQIESVSAQFENGYRLKQGDWLAKLENSDYIAALEQAKQSLAAAEVSLLEEQRQGQQALLEWQTSGLTGQPESELVLRQPQLKAAQTQVAQANASVKSAEKELGYTTIKSPFAALVVERMVAPGSYVQKGSEIARLYSIDRVEVDVALSEKEWQNLPSLEVLSAGEWPATLTSVEDGTVWSGYVVRTGQHVNSETRQRSLVIAVDNPFEHEPALYPGTFVRAELAGQPSDNLWQLPASALSQRGEIWFVDEQNTLAKLSATPVFTTAQSIFVNVPAELADKKVAVLSHPLNSYLPGMQISPVEVDHD